MYIVLAKDSPTLASLQSSREAQEVTATADGERVFVIRRDLKKD